MNLFQGLVQVLAVKQKKRRSEDMKKRIQAASQKRIVRSPPIFGLSLPLTACPGSSKSREVEFWRLSEFSFWQFVIYFNLAYQPRIPYGHTNTGSAVPRKCFKTVLKRCCATSED